MSKTKILSCYALLMLLAIGSMFYHTWFSSKQLLIVAACLTMTIKTQQIIDIFMELATAPKRWRYLLFSYSLLVPLAILVIYW